MVHLWRGFHQPELPSLLTRAWKQNELVILLPPHLKEFSFFKKLAAEDLEFHGQWSEDLKDQCKKLCGSQTNTEIKNLAIGVFTSGTSTGINRLVFYSKENILASLSSIRELFDTKRIQKIFCYPQPTHTFGLVLGYLQAMLNDIELCFSPGSYSREAHAEWFKKVDRNTLTLGAPAHFQDLMQYLKANQLKPQESYSAIVGGARVSIQLWERMKSELLIEAPSIGYGATEASPGVTHLPPGVKPAVDGDIGFALRNVEIQLSEKGLEFKGPNVCHAILENNELKKPHKILLQDSVVFTLAENKTRYSYLGRTDSIINRGGIKISLDHVEAFLNEKLKAPVLALSLFDSRLGDELGLVIQSEDLAIKLKIQTEVKAEWGFHIDETSILLATIPLNPNGKGDRTTATKLLLKQKTWNFPVSVEHLRNLLPHKGPAIWVDSILGIDATTATGTIKLREDRPYYSRQDGKIFVRETACIEWVAQTYGYTLALGDVLGIRKADVASRTFIAEVKSAEFHFNEFHQNLKQGDEIQVKVHCTHDFGNLKVVEGQVFHDSNLLALISVKLYCG